MTTIKVQIWACLILFITTFVGAVYDLSQKLQPTGNLMIQLDYNLALTSGSGNKLPTPNQRQDARNVVYTSYLEFANDVGTIENGQLFQMVTDAYNEINSEQKQYGFNNDQGRPTVMNIIAVGNYVLFASNQKGQTSFTLSLPNSRVAKSLQICQIVFASEMGFPDDFTCTTQGSSCRHGNGYNCGEIMAAHLWYRLNPGYTTMAGLRGRVLAVWSVNGEIVPKDPCGTGNPTTWGCNKFVADQGLTVIPDVPLLQYDLTTIAGGLLYKGQVQLCS